jgi:hypothetical protein
MNATYRAPPPVSTPRAASPLERVLSSAQPIPIGRNTALLSGSLAMNSATLQLAAPVASLTLVRVLDIEGLLGLGRRSRSARARSQRCRSGS